MKAISEAVFAVLVLVTAQVVPAAVENGNARNSPVENDVSGQGQERAQLARIHEQNDEFILAAEQYELAIEEIELADGQFSRRLIEPLTGLGRSYLALGEHDLADEALKRAQHLIHRHEGVYSLSQISILNLMTENFLQLNESLDADRQQRLALFISEHQYGKNNVDLIPALYKLGDWYMQTGQFRDARELFERAIDIIESDGGTDDLRLLKPLQLIAETRRLEGLCCSYKSLETALEVIENNANATNELMVDVHLALGDAYIASRKEEQAHQYYKRAWQLSDEGKEHLAKPHKIVMSNTLDRNRPTFTRYYRVEHDAFGRRRLERMTPEEKRALGNQPPQEFLLPLSDQHYDIKIADERDRFNDEVEPVTRLVGRPFKFNYQQLRYILPLNKRDNEKLGDLSITAQFTVDVDGDVEDIEIVDSNAPIKLERLMRRVLRETQFRPAFDDGNPVKTEKVTLTQTFQ